MVMTTYDEGKQFLNLSAMNFSISIMAHKDTEHITGNRHYQFKGLH